jgi:hypothetical protein
MCAIAAPALAHATTSAAISSGVIGTFGFCAFVVPAPHNAAVIINFFDMVYSFLIFISLINLINIF